MRVWITFRYEPSGPPLLVASEDNLPGAEKFRDQLARFSGNRYAILPVDIPDADVAGLFGEKSVVVCKKCDGKGRLIHSTTWNATGPEHHYAPCWTCNGTGEERAR